MEVTFVNRGVREGLSEQVTLGQRPEGGWGGSRVDTGRGSSQRAGQGPGPEEEQAQGSWSRKGGGKRVRGMGRGDGGDAGLGATVHMNCVPVRQEPWDVEQSRGCPAPSLTGSPDSAWRVTGAGPRQRQGPGRRPLHRSRRDGDGPGGGAEEQEESPDVGPREGRANRS